MFFPVLSAVTTINNQALESSSKPETKIIISSPRYDL